MSQVAVQFFKDYESELKTELGPRFKSQSPNFLVGDPADSLTPIQDLVWAQNILFDYTVKSFDSISQAGDILRASNLLWVNSSEANYRRSELIQQRLPKVKNRIHQFGTPLPPQNVGQWFLIDSHTIAFASNTRSPFPEGKVIYHEDKVNPPSRAYLKLWELLDTESLPIKNTQAALELGAAPGGWSWVLSQKVKHLHTVDRSALADNIAQLKNINHQIADAFSLRPQKSAYQWIFSDLICYPEKLLSYIKSWIEEDPDLCFAVTLKFHGKTDFKVIELFQHQLNARVRHLYNNKHEATAWIKVRSL